MSNYTKMSEEILSSVGGVTNIEKSYHCITRLRLNLIDKTIVDKDHITAIDGVSGIREQQGQLQIIIGPTVGDLYEAFEKVVENESGIKQQALVQEAAAEPEQKTGLFGKITAYAADIFIPIIPCLAGAGMIQAILSLCSYFKWIDTNSGFYIVLNLIQNAVFYFLPFLVALSLARKLKTNEFFALVMAAIILSPVITKALASGVKSYDFIHLPIYLANSSSTVIPIILSIFLMAYVEKFLNKVIHPSMRIFLVSGLTFIIVGVVTLAAFAPLGILIGNGLLQVIKFLLSTNAALGGTVLGAIHLLMVVTGTHFIEIPLITQEMASGQGTAIMAITSTGGVALLGCLCALRIKTKNPAKKAEYNALIPMTFVGVTEPALFGVAIANKIVLAASIIGGGVGGLIIALSRFKLTAIGVPTPILSWLANIAIPNSIWYLMGSIAAFVVGFSIVFVLNRKEVTNNEQ